MPSAAILAGGQARRFGGVDKSALLIDGERILDRQLRELTDVADEVLLVGYRGAAGQTGVRVIADRMADAGPLGGLDAALAAARHDRVLLLACDMPFVTAALMQHLLTISAVENADIVVPRTERGYHPLCAAYARRCAPVVGQQLTARTLRMIDLFERVAVRVVEGSELSRFGDPRWLLANVNTPDEFEAIGARGGNAVKECHEP